MALDIYISVFCLHLICLFSINLSSHLNVPNGQNNNDLYDFCLFGLFLNSEHLWIIKTYYDSKDINCNIQREFYFSLTYFINIRRQ